ncbi:MAG: DedA family protein, partial [Acidimicrobiales bacterium]
VLPGLVGMSGMSRRLFAVCSAIGAVAWGALWVLVGFAVGLSYSKVTSTVGRVTLIVVLAAAVVLLVVWARRRHGGGRRRAAGGES